MRTRLRIRLFAALLPLVVVGAGCNMVRAKAAFKDGNRLYKEENYRQAIKWGVISLVAFVVPDIYIFAGTRTLPTRIIVVLCAIIGSMLALAVVSIVRKIRKGRAERAALLEATASVHGHA